jgi:hypothetical protein
MSGASAARAEIEEIVNRETRAWDMQDLDLLMTIFHPSKVGGDGAGDGYRGGEDSDSTSV